MDNSGFKVSVLMPAFNAEKYIEAAIESILLQSHSNLELLIQDDGSTDATLEIALKFAAIDERVRILPPFERNRGIIDARNALLDAARGEYLAWMDSDDVSLPLRLEAQLRFLTENPSFSVVGGAIALADEQLYVYDAKYFPADPELQKNDPYIACQTIMCRRSEHVISCHFRSFFSLGGEDGDWLLRIADVEKITNIEEIILIYRVRDGLSGRNANAIRRLGGYARAAARERRLGNSDFINAVSSCERFISDTGIVNTQFLSASEKVEILNTPFSDQERIFSIILLFIDIATQDEIEKCISGINSQNFKNFEVIIIIRDNTVLPGFHFDSSIRVRFFFYSHELFSKENLLRLYKFAVGQFLVFQSADSYARENRLYNLLLHYFNNLDIVAVGSGVNIYRGNEVVKSLFFPKDAIENKRLRGLDITFSISMKSLIKISDTDSKIKDISDLLILASCYGKVENIEDIGIFTSSQTIKKILMKIIQKTYYSFRRLSKQNEKKGIVPNLQSNKEFHLLSKTPLLSVVVYIDHLCDNIDHLYLSLSKQSFKNFEVILWHYNGFRISTTPQTELTCFKVSTLNYGEEMSSIALIDLINNISGKYVAWHYGSDCSYDCRFEMQINALELQSDITAVGCAVNFLDRVGVMRSVFFDERLRRSGSKFSGCPESFMIHLAALQSFANKVEKDKKFHNLSELIISICSHGNYVNIPEVGYFVKKSPGVISNYFSITKSIGFSECTYSCESVCKSDSVYVDQRSKGTLLGQLNKNINQACKASQYDTVVFCYENWYDFNDALKYMTPGQTGIWDRVLFTNSFGFQSDYAVILNHPGESTVQLFGPAEKIIFAIGEPPTKQFRQLHLGQGENTLVLSSDKEVCKTKNQARRFILEPCFTRSWSMRKSYDELKVDLPIAFKQRNLSWITSNLAMVPGHKVRLDFLEKIKGKIEFDLFGRGFNPVADKWDALAPYKYSIAFENSFEDNYFTEKLMDCFVAEAMPIYFGSPNILRYFPERSMIIFDLNDPQIIEKISEVITSRLYLDNRAYVLEAKDLVLNKYNIFARLADFCKKTTFSEQDSKEFTIKPVYLDFSDDGESTPDVDLAYPFFTDK